jgi:tripartite-type tricarboxylate transporter receptor subunit TctC
LRMLRTMAIVVLAALAAHEARAAWPDRTLTLIVIFAPGGSNDLLGRLIAAELAPTLGQNVIVENRVGANGNIGLAAAAQAAIAGTTDLASVNVSGLIGHIQSGTLKPLVQTGKERWPDLPEVPTLEQAGIPNAVVDTSQMFLAPAGTPAPIVEGLAKETHAILHKPDVRDKMLKASFAVKYEGPDELRARIAREVPMWKELVERAGIRDK